MVYLKLQPYQQSTIFCRAHQKLASKYFGRYPILQKIGSSVAYKLQLPKGLQISPVLHVSLLKKFVGELP